MARAPYRVEIGKVVMTSWITSVVQSAANDPLLDWILKPGAVRFANREGLSCEELITMVLSVQSSRKHLDFLIYSPFTSSNFAIAATAGILLADFLQRAKGGLLIRGNLLLVTRQVGRGIADLTELRLSNVDLRQIWKVHSATQAEKSSVSRHPSVIVVSPQPNKIADIAGEVDTVVIDATHPLTLERLEDIFALPLVRGARQRTVVLPLGHQSALVDMDWLVWTWDFETLNQCRREFNEPADDWADQWDRDFLVCHDESIDSLLLSARRKLSLLSRSTGGHANSFLPAAWGILNRLGSLAVPLAIYEDTAFRHMRARTIRERLDFLSQQSPSEIDDKGRAVWASEWQPLIVSLQNLYQNLRGDYPAKFWGVARLVDDRVRSGFEKPLLLVCPTQLEGNILIRELGKLINEVLIHLHPEGLIIANPRYLAELRQRWDFEIVATGKLVSRWRYLDATLQKLTYIVYPSEVTIEQADLTRRVKAIKRNATHSGRLETLSKLMLCDTLEHENSDDSKSLMVNCSVIDVEGVPERQVYIEEKAVSIEELITPEFAWDADDLSYVPPMQSRPKTLSKVDHTVDLPQFEGPRVELTFSNGSVWIVPGDEIFDVFRTVTEEIDEQAAIDLQVGDIVILLDEEGYGHLFDRIVEALEQHQNFSLMGVWLNLWEIAKYSALERCDNMFSCLHSELSDRGIQISEQAVRSWYKGVMGPRDENIVFTLIDISSIPAAVKHKSQIRKALGHVRGMRRVAGRRIRQMVRQAAVDQEVPATLSNAIDLAVEDVLSASTRVMVNEVKVLES